MKYREFCSQHQKNVELFVEKAGQNCPKNGPEVPDRDTRKLCANLIMEEAIETVEALGFKVYLYNPPESYKKPFMLQNFKNDEDISLEEIIDGCCDTHVVVTSTLVQCGVPDIPFQEEVDQNNLDKFKDGYSIREDGKLLKSPSHVPPRIGEILERLK